MVFACLHALPFGHGYSVGRCPPCGVRPLFAATPSRGFVCEGLRLFTALRCLRTGSGRPTLRPLRGLAYGLDGVAASSGAPGLHPPPRTATARAIAATGATASNTLAVQGVGLLVASGRLPPASGCTCWGRFARGVHAGRLYPNRCGAAVGSPSTPRLGAVSSAPTAWRVRAYARL